MLLSPVSGNIDPWQIRGTLPENPHAPPEADAAAVIEHRLGGQIAASVSVASENPSPSGTEYSEPSS